MKICISITRVHYVNICALYFGKSSDEHGLGSGYLGEPTSKGKVLKKSVFNQTIVQHIYFIPGRKIFYTF